MPTDIVEDLVRLGAQGWGTATKGAEEINRLRSQLANMTHDAEEITKRYAAYISPEQHSMEISKDSRDAKRLRVLMQWGVRHSMEHPISDPTQPYYTCLNAGERGKCTAHGATLDVLADRAIEWLARHGNPEAPK